MYPGHCIGCGRSLTDKRYLKPGFAGILRHVCPDWREKEDKEEADADKVGAGFAMAGQAQEG
jgi:hypothetical protein